MDWLFYAVMGTGIGVLAAAARRRAATTRRRVARFGMSARPDLTRVPAELQRTVLWALCEGGTERSVVGGTLSLAAHDVDVTCFDLEDLRRKRFEWAWLDVDAPFRLHTPTTIVACTLPRALPHLVVKRAGKADRIAARPTDDLSEVRSAAEAAPATLARAPVDLSAAPIAGTWRAWGPPAAAHAADDTRRLLVALGTDLDRDARGRELVVETLGPLVLLYAASGGPLAELELEDMIDAAVGVCERLLAATPALDPRGVSG